jgi:hypothetical protein
MSRRSTVIAGPVRIDGSTIQEPGTPRLAWWARSVTLSVVRVLARTSTASGGTR